MRRVTSLELLDEDQGRPRDIETSFDDLWRINRWLGGVSGSLRLLRLFFQRTGVHELRILDVGAGDARMTNYLGRKLRRGCPGTQIVALDRRLSHLQNCRRATGDIRRVTADVMNLPFSPASFDVVTCNLFLHHFSDAAAVELLRILLATAREAVLVNDLERKWLAYWIVAYAPWIARSPITRSDGRASVRQAYTPREIQALAAQSGAVQADVIDLPFFRLGLVLWKRQPGACA
jgi:SAM-dependent methyltransferase